MPMTVDNVTSIDETETKLRQGYADMTAMYQDNFNAVMAAGQAAISGFQAVNAELLAFLQSRAKDGLTTGQRLAECGSPEMAIEVQLDYTKFALQAYIDEFGKLNELTGRVLVDVMAPLKGRADVVTQKTAAALAA
jgi:hypothetical protein